MKRIVATRQIKPLPYKGKHQEYIKRDAIANILAKMARWGITMNDLQESINKLGLQEVKR